MKAAGAVMQVISDIEALRKGHNVAIIAHHGDEVDESEASISASSGRDKRSQSQQGFELNSTSKYSKSKQDRRSQSVYMPRLSLGRKKNSGQGLEYSSSILLW